jgi:hypothetical protein
MICIMELALCKKIFDSYVLSGLLLLMLLEGVAAVM